MNTDNLTLYGTNDLEIIARIICRVAEDLEVYGARVIYFHGEAK